MVNLLPLGSVVLLKNGKKRLMIYGRKQKAVADNQAYDYIACLYPEGNINENFNYLFNHEDIENIVFRGYSDADDEMFLDYLSNSESV